MDIVQALRVAQELKTAPSKGRTASDQARFRIARSYLKKAIANPGNVMALDAICRLQVLEGVGGVSDGTWWHKGVRGLPHAEAHFENPKIDKGWFATGSSGMFKQIRNIVSKMLSSTSIQDVEAEDIMQDGISGLTREKPLYETGKRMKESDLEKRSPLNLARGTAGKFFSRMALNVINRHNRHQKIMLDREDDPESWIHNQSLQRRPGAVLEEVFLTPSDPLGNKIRKFMRKIWDSTPQAETMAAFMDLWENSGRIPTTNEVATRLLADEKGKGPEGARAFNRSELRPVQQRVKDHWKRALPVFDAAWRKNRSLHNELEARFIAQGASPGTWDPSDLFQNVDPSMFGTFPRWKGKTAAVSRVSIRWFNAHDYFVS